jgi:hypothetical protein
MTPRIDEIAPDFALQPRETVGGLHDILRVWRSGVEFDRQKLFVSAPVSGLALIRHGQLYARRGPSLLVDTRDECDEAEQLSGYDFREARFLRTLRPEINGRRTTHRVTTSVRSGPLNRRR